MAKRAENALKAPERRAILVEKINELGVWGINYSELAREWGVTPQQVHLDKQYILKKCEIAGVEEVQFELDTGHKLALQQMRDILANSPKKSDRVAAARAFAEISEKYTKFQEAYGIKEKIADKIEHRGAQVLFNVNDPNDKYPEVSKEPDN